MNPCVSLCFLSLVSVALARTVGPTSVNDLPETRTKPEVAGYLSDFRALYKLYEECSATEFSPCLKKKVVLALDRVGRTSKHLSIAEGVEFVKDATVQDSTPVSEEELETSLPRALEEKDSALNQMIFDKVIYFFKTHTLEFKLFDEASGRNLQEEGRRRHRFNSLMMFPLLFGGMLVPLAYGALALLAGKALIISKLALALAAIVGLKKLVGGGGGESYQVVQVPHHGGGHYKRSLEEDSAHKLAYKAYMTADKLQGF